jgi:hypothetical protein
MLAALVVDLLTLPHAPILLAIDETLMRRRGPKIYGGFAPVPWRHRL